jgi:hypothetical protein
MEGKRTMHGRSPQSTKTSNIGRNKLSVVVSVARCASSDLSFSEYRSSPMSDPVLHIGKNTNLFIYIFIAKLDRKVFAKEKLRQT